VTVQHADVASTVCRPKWLLNMTGHDMYDAQPFITNTKVSLMCIRRHNIKHPTCFDPQYDEMDVLDVFWMTFGLASFTSCKLVRRRSLNTLYIYQTAKRTKPPNNRHPPENDTGHYEFPCGPPEGFALTQDPVSLTGALLC
jgi:hypothetical protein